MQKNNVVVLPLYAFFEQLRENEYPLGVGDYQQLIKALEYHLGIPLDQYGGFVGTLTHRSGPASLLTELYPKDLLLRICKLLWFKPGKSQIVFEELFDKHYTEDFEPFNDYTKHPHDPDATLAPPTPNIIPPEIKDDRPALPREHVNPDDPMPRPEDAALFRDVLVRFEVEQGGKENRSGPVSDNDNDINNTKFLLTKDYYPINKRRIHQTIKTFPLYQTTRRSNRIDINATVDRIVTAGYFKGFVWEKDIQATSTLALLIDNSDDMAAFEPLSEILCSAFSNVLNSKKWNAIHVFYFFNAADTYFFRNSTHTNFVESNAFLRSIAATKFSAVIVSDAGAATGSRDVEKISSAQSLLSRLYAFTNKVAWINPLPRERWKLTTAEHISNQAAMFEGSEAGIKSAVDFLKGATQKFIEKDGSN